MRCRDHDAEWEALRISIEDEATDEALRLAMIEKTGGTEGRCLSCGSTKGKVIDEDDGNGMVWCGVLCLTCGYFIEND